MWTAPRCEAASPPVSAAEGKEVTTIEGLDASGNHPVQRAWRAHNVPQCGYCQSGQIMSAAALLNGNPDPSDDDIVSGMAGNICRCGHLPANLRRGPHGRPGGVIMSRIQNISRRDFLKHTGATGALVLGAQIVPGLDGRGPVQAQATGQSVQPNLFVGIADDGTVTITCSRSEMGQGVRTGIPMILADELEADWHRVSIWQAPGDETKYDPAGKDGQNTDGSRSTRHHLDVMRELGAAGRYVLEQAAARKWGVDASEVYAKHHRLYHSVSGQSFDFGEVVDAAADIMVPTGDAAPKLKDPSQWKYIGRDMPVVDNYDMSTGGANFGADASIPGMKIAVVARAPVYRGKVKSYDAAEGPWRFRASSRLVEIPALPDDTPAEFHAMGGIAVVGTNTWSVLEGRRLLDIEWDDGPNVAHDSGTYDDKLREASRTGGHIIRDRGNVDDGFASADKVVEAEYFVPYFIHTPMEPPAALVDANVRPVRIITSTQSPNETRQYVAKALGLEKTDVSCEVTLLGGGFGRKSKPDFACEAAILSKMVGGAGAGAVDPRGRDPQRLLPRRERSPDEGRDGRERQGHRMAPHRRVGRPSSGCGRRRSGPATPSSTGSVSSTRLTTRCRTCASRTARRTS